MSVCPVQTQISLGIHPVWSESLLSAWRKLGSLATHWAHTEDWSDWVDAQADPSLRLAHNHFVGFVMSWLISTVGHDVEKLGQVEEITNVLFLTSENEISGIIYRLFRGKQNIFLIIFNTKFVLKCAAKLENRLTNTKVTSKNIHE